MTECPYCGEEMGDGEKYIVLNAGVKGETPYQNGSNTYHRRCLADIINSPRFESVPIAMSHILSASVNEDYESPINK